VKDRCAETLTACLQLDLRHSDAIIVSQCGPLAVNVGGTFEDDDGNTQTYAYEVVNWLDDMRVCKTWDTVGLARAWQDEVELRIRTMLTSLRDEYLTEYPGEFMERHRRV
jgi:hypothetical protein